MENSYSFTFCGPPKRMPYVSIQKQKQRGMWNCKFQRDIEINKNFRDIPNKILF